MRRCFLEIDLAQAEWVVTAFYAGDERMIEVFEKNLDPHVRTGSLITGAPESFVRLEHEAGKHITDPTELRAIRANLEVPAGVFLPRTMTIRQAGKKSNHGLNYEEGYKRFALENEIEEAEGKRLVEAYHRAYPGLRGSMYPRIQQQLQKDRTLVTCFGDKRRFLKAWNNDLLKVAYSFIPQATVGRITNWWFRSIYEDTSSLTEDVWVAAQVHDSGLLDSPLMPWPDMAELATLSRKYMSIRCRYHGREFMLRTDFKIGPNWGHMAEVKETGDLAKDLEEAWESAQKKAA